LARFRTRARAVDLLGKQQIRDEVTAISELLRNSYDADAYEGIIRVNTVQEYINVFDDGEGMTESVLIDNWLTIGTYSKEIEKHKKTLKGRAKIGEKGIGRLAISLLGDQLLIFSKDSISKQWAILYLHWELFRNSNLFLEQIELPTKTFNSLEELIEFLENDFDIFKNQLLSNLSISKLWNEQSIKRITNEIKDFLIVDETKKNLKKIESRGQGTNFYVRNLENSWNWDLYSTVIEEESRTERKERLQNVLVSFSNLIDLFDNELDEDNEKGFFPKIEINNVKLERETWFNPEDLALYDYALKGTIENGFFKGTAYVRDTEKTAEFNIEQVRLTNGIHTKTEKCGPIRVKWFFLEGQKKNSSLSEDQFRIMNDKLLRGGGIYVFRDGLRILPYGEQGNDFLKIEERRTKSAGYYLFSHRRMYGFMEISKETNPELMDKSSREGFIENDAYKYFKTVGSNLLVWWARDFLESAKENGKRQERISRLNEVRKREEKAVEQQRKEEKLEKEYFQNLKAKLKNFDTDLFERKKEINTYVKNVLEDYKNKILNFEIESAKREDSFFNILKKIYSSTDTLYELEFYVNLRYFHDNELIEQINQNNDEISKEIKELRLVFETEANNINRLLDDLEEEQNDHKWLYSLRDEMIKKTSDVEKEIDTLFSELSVSYENKLNGKLNVLNQEVLSSQDTYLKNLRNDFNTTFSRKLSEIHQGVEEILNENSDEIFEKNAKNILKDLEVLKKNVYENALSLDYEIKNSSIHKNIEHLINDFLTKLRSPLQYEEDDALIGILKKEVDMYRDLSAVGLAAELTSHEFNALYSEINQDISFLYRTLKNTKVLPIVERTRRSFKSLERLHQRMSPLYRQIRARKGKIKFKEFVDDMFSYFESDFQRYEIKFINNLSNSIEIQENDSVLFTPLINILSNAIYWVLDQERKEIHFYMENNKFFIHDTGPGVPEKDRLRIFDPFFSKRSEGRGLGLFLSKDILEAKGHKLYLVEKADELYSLNGACFCIEFNKDAIKGEDLDEHGGN